MTALGTCAHDLAPLAWASTTNIQRNFISEFGWIALARTEWVDAAIAGRPLIGDVIADAHANLGDA
jgi:hypothetical protein